jgi:hypothetical protein
MGDNVLKLPLINLEVPKPQRWDFIAAATLVVIAVVCGANLKSALGRPPGEALSGTLTFGFVVAQFLLTTVALLVLGKTAKHGTLWGNLLAVGALVAGMSGVLLAAALWTSA